MTDSTGSTDVADVPAPSRHPLALLRDPATIRVRCAAVLGSVEDNNSANFRLNRDALGAVADRVAALTLRRFPDLRIPYHSRWRHFEAGGVDRKAELDALLQGRDRAERARVHFDLTVVSVLLDAGAGPRWHYTESKVLDPLALPAQHHGSDDLLALLDRAARPKAAAAADDAPTPTAAAGGVSRPAVRPDVARRQALHQAATLPHGGEDAQQFTQNLGGADLAAPAVVGDAVVQQARAGGQAVACGLCVQGLAQAADQAGAAFQTHHRVAGRSLEDAAQSRCVYGLQRGGVAAQRVVPVRREGARHEGAEAGHAQAF